MIKKILYTALFFSISSACFAQGYYQGLDRKYKKYFVGGTVGAGYATWISNMGSTELYDKDGTIIISGDIRFKAHNSTKLMNIEVSAPIMKVRFGLGICFEDFFLDKLALRSNTPSADKSIIIFDERFRFEKFYTQIEVPFKFDTDKPYSFSFKGHLGYFGYSGIKRFNFFGERALAHTFFTTLGLVADYRIFSHTYIYINPNFEYKFFKNSNQDAPSNIRHNIFTFNMVGGLRFDVSRE